MASKIDLTILQGETFSRTLTLTNSSGTAMDLTSYTARASIRQTADSSVKTVDFTCAFVTPRTSGQITLALTATQTSAIPTTGKQAYDKYAKYVWDIELIAPDTTTVTRIANGNVLVSPEVTR